MTSPLSTSTGLLALIAVAAVGCGGGNSVEGVSAGKNSSGGHVATGSGGTPSASGGSGGAEGGARTDAGPGTGGGGAGGTIETGAGGAVGGGGSPSGGSPSGGAPACAGANAWDVTYDLDGTTFSIRDTPGGIGDQVNTCTPPYTADNQIGPGTMVLRFPDAGGAPGPGSVHFMKYTMDLTFNVAGSTSMASALSQTEVAGVCGAEGGTFDGTAIHWNDPGPKLHTFGTLTCTGSLCFAGGFTSGTPMPQDYTAPQALNDFTFTNGVGSFSMPEVLVMKDSTSSEWVAFKGTETGRQPVCDCP